MVEANDFLNKLKPLEKFAEWFADAKAISEKHPDIYKHPEAFVLSTCTKNEPSSRVLLMKEIRKNGLVFYSNYLSRKGQDIHKNPNVALNFFWSPLFRQVNFRGTIKKLSKKESEKYWAIRPRDSQISQYASQQSHKVKDREQLESEWLAIEKKFNGKEVPLPPNWGGYLFTPTYVEFWVGRDGRFHDRYVYSQIKSQWKGQRLYP